MQEVSLGWLSLINFVVSDETKNYIGKFEYNRYIYYHELDQNNLVISHKSLLFGYKFGNFWSKWKPYFMGLESIPEVHRGLCVNELVVESDYPEYTKNLSIVKRLGALIEAKGWKPMYFYSGNKSIHIHLFLDYYGLQSLNNDLLIKVSKVFKSVDYFFVAFIDYLRNLFVNGFGLFDFELDVGFDHKHLIRAEGSKHKKGYKTFLGTTYKGLSDKPYIANVSNGFIPLIPLKPIFSLPNNIEVLINNFLLDYESRNQRKLIKRRNSLNFELKNKDDRILALLSKLLNLRVSDGRKRLVFLLVNGLKNFYKDDEIEVLINNWNSLQDVPLRENVIKYLLKRDYIYKYSYDRLINELSSLGINVRGVLNGTV